MKFVTPVTQRKKHELEEQLLVEEKRLLNAVRLGSRAIKAQLNPVYWIKKHPIETILVVLATGILIGKNINGAKKLPPAIELT